MGFPHGSEGKESAHNAGVLGLIPVLGRSPGVREQLLTPVFLSGEFQGQRSLTGYSPWGHKESDMTETLSFSRCCEEETIGNNLEDSNNVTYFDLGDRYIMFTL